MLFVPANNTRLIEKAHTRGADALILDLEDSVREQDKSTARASLPDTIARLTDAGALVLVRVDASRASLSLNLAVAVQPSVRGIVLPKVDNAASLTVVSKEVSMMEAALGIPVGTIPIIAMIESSGAVFKLSEIAAAPRVIGLALGSEDLALELGVRPTPLALTFHCQMIAMAAAAHGHMALGLPTSIAEYRDLEALREAAICARSIGMTGALCIHPAQVAIVNEAFTVPADDVTWAQAVVDAWDKAKTTGSAVTSHGGRMIDRPVVERARCVLSRAKPRNGVKK